MTQPVDLRIIPAKLIQAGETPLPGDFVGVGELISNAADGRLFLKLVTGEVVEIGGDLREALAAIDLANYAPLAHAHQINQVDGLQAAIDAIVAELQGKQPSGDYATLTQLNTGLSGKAGLSGVSGAFTVGNNFSANVVSANNHIIAGTTYRIGTTTVLRLPTQQGWQNPTGPISTATFHPSTATLLDVAKRLAGIQAQLISHGILSTQGTTIA